MCEVLFEENNDKNFLRSIEPVSCSPNNIFNNYCVLPTFIFLSINPAPLFSGKINERKRQSSQYKRGNPVASCLHAKPTCSSSSASLCPWYRSQCTWLRWLDSTQWSVQSWKQELRWRVAEASSSLRLWVAECRPTSSFYFILKCSIFMNYFKIQINRNIWITPGYFLHSHFLVSECAEI